MGVHQFGFKLTILVFILSSLSNYNGIDANVTYEETHVEVDHKMKAMIPEKNSSVESIPQATNGERIGVKVVGQEGGHHFHAVKRLQGEFIGVKGKLNVWQPSVPLKDGHFSLCQLWLSLETPEKNVTLEVGWHVYPSLYENNDDGDKNIWVRFFTFYTADNYKEPIPCYNLRCDGFISKSDHLIPGRKFDRASVYGGPQYEIEIEVRKEAISGNWELNVDGIVVGYWKRELFPDVEYFNVAMWGGEVCVGKEEGEDIQFPEMGSGKSPTEGVTKAAIVRSTKVTLRNQNVWIDATGTTDIMNKPECYTLAPFVDQPGVFFYGGFCKQHRKGWQYPHPPPTQP